MVLNNQKRLLAIDDSIQFEYLKLQEEMKPLTRLIHTKFLKLALDTNDIKLLNTLREDEKLLKEIGI